MTRESSRRTTAPSHKIVIGRPGPMSRIIGSHDDLRRARVDDSLRYAANAGGNSQSHSCRRPVESVITTASPLPGASDGTRKVARHVLAELLAAARKRSPRRPSSSRERSVNCSVTPTSSSSRLKVDSQNCGDNSASKISSGRPPELTAWLRTPTSKAECPRAGRGSLCWCANACICS